MQGVCFWGVQESQEYRIPNDHNLSSGATPVSFNRSTHPETLAVTSYKSVHPVTRPATAVRRGGGGAGPADVSDVDSAALCHGSVVRRGSLSLKRLCVGTAPPPPLRTPAGFALALITGFWGADYSRVEG